MKSDMDKHTQDGRMEQADHTQEKEKAPKSKRSRYIKITLLILAAVLLVIAGRFVYTVFYDPQGAFDKPPPVRTPVVQTPAAPTATPDERSIEAQPAVATPTPEPTLSPEEELAQQADMEFMKNKVNILLLGWDQSPEREDEDSVLFRDEKNNFRSDVLILLTVDFEKKTADLISVPRDTYAPIYNTKGRWKINSAFAHGGSVKGNGFTYAMNTVSDLLGVPIEYYAGVDMVGLKAVVDAMGGVDYDVDVEIRLNGRILTKGFQHLDGQQVLDYCRARKGISTDVGRADRQQRMLFSIFEQLKTRNQLVNLPNIYTSVADKVETNLNLEQIAALTVFALNLDMKGLNRHTLEGEYINNVGSNSASFYVLYNNKLKTLVKDIFGINIKTNAKYDVSYVKGEKAAAASTAYISGAQYLLSVFSSASDAGNVRSALGTLQSAAVEASAGEGSYDASEIDHARDALRNAMYSMCINNGITQANVIKSKLPADFYNMLPAAASGTTPSTSSGMPVNTPRPSRTPVPGEELPDEPVG